MNVSLSEQRCLFEEWRGESINRIIRWLSDSAMREAIVAIARDRLLDGYKAHGDEMYQWDEETRRRNAFEELADCIVYITSGEV